MDGGTSAAACSPLSVRASVRSRHRLLLVQRFQVRVDLGIINVECLLGRCSWVRFQLRGAVFAEPGDRSPTQLLVDPLQVVALAHVAETPARVEVSSFKILRWRVAVQSRSRLTRTRVTSRLRNPWGSTIYLTGRFPANAAWLAVQVMAHKLARWTARIGLGEPVMTIKALRRRFFSLAGRITRKARCLTLHLPQDWPWQNQFSSALARLRAPPLPS